MTNPSTDQEIRQFLRQRISGISTAAEDDILARIKAEKAALLDELEVWSEYGRPEEDVAYFVETHRAKLTKEDK